MSLIALFSDKGSPGVTTLGLALAHAWPARATLAELDPAGGDLALRLSDGYGRPVLAQEPGLLTFAAAARRDALPSLTEHGQSLPGASGSRVVPGISAPEQAGAMAGLWGAVVSSITAGAEGDVILDLGRLHTGSPVFAAAGTADVLVGVCHADPASMLRLRDRTRHILAAAEPRPGRKAVVVLVAEDRQAGEAIAAMREVLRRGAVAAEVAGVLVVDAIAVRALQAGDVSQRVQRSLLMRSAASLAAELAGVPSAEATVLPPPQRRRVFARSR